MKCKVCGKQFGSEEERELGVCLGCWEEFCESAGWEQFGVVAEGAD